MLLERSTDFGISSLQMYLPQSMLRTISAGNSLVSVSVMMLFVQSLPQTVRTQYRGQERSAACQFPFFVNCLIFCLNLEATSNFIGGIA